MTKSTISAIAVSAFMFGMVSIACGFDSAKWKYRATVTIESGTDKYSRLILTPDVYNAARPDLGDIRLIDSSGKQVAYIIARPQDRTERQQYKPSVINRSTSAENAAMVTLDFGQKVVKNSIEVITKGDNFRRMVKIEGSNDNTEFFTLVKRAYVFAVGQDKHFEQIGLPTNDYRYWRITVWPMPDENNSPVIEEVKTFKVVEKIAQRQQVEMVSVEHSEDEKNKSSIYVYDLTYQHLPISEIELDVTSDSFYRFVSIEGRDQATRKVEIASEDNRQRFEEVEVPWERLVSDTIYRYAEPGGEKCEKLVIRVYAGRRVHRYLKITIANYDDEPVEVEKASAKMIADEVVFAADDNTELVLYAGSASAGMPQYDIKYRLTNPLEAKTKSARLSSITDNPLFREAEQKLAPWTERHRILLLIALIVVALVLGRFILKSFKSIRSEQSQS
jgi:hypothetical protein